MFSEIENPADKINENLPPQIRILGKILKHKKKQFSQILVVRIEDRAPNPKLILELGVFSLYFRFNQVY